MYEKLLNETEKFLEGQKENKLTILEIWDGMLERSEELKIEMPENIGDFECLLEGDKRFTFINNKLAEELDVLDVGEEEGEYEVGEDFFQVEEMEKLGFNQHQLVGLKKNQKKTSSEDDDDDLPNFAPHLGNEKSGVKKRTGTSPVKSKTKSGIKRKK